MKQSGYRAVVHIYLLFLLSLLGTVLLAGCLLFLAIAIRTPDGTIKRSDWPKVFTEDFNSQIIFVDHSPQIKQTGIALLRDNEIGVQILNSSGIEVFSEQKPEQAQEGYSSADLLKLSQTGKLEDSEMTAFAGTVSGDGQDYVYLLYFPENISKVTMYVNGERFAGGKRIILPILLAMLFLVLISGALYGLYTARAMKRLTTAVWEISARSYLPARNHGMFQELYDSLNALDAEIRASDGLRAQTGKMREEWIANITHDLKTPLSPIKGYAEILQEPDCKGLESCSRYAGIILKNVSYMETLIGDLKLTYQLESGMLPINREEKNVVRFLKELVIDILNTPEYESRTIHFESAEESVFYSFDQTLFSRAFRNLIINAFVHGEEDTEVTLHISVSDDIMKLSISDNGKGMSPETVEHLFDRYYRGTNTEQKPEGSGLGLAIAKGIVELHDGSISVSSISQVGTVFKIYFHPVKVN